MTPMLQRGVTYKDTFQNVALYLLWTSDPKRTIQKLNARAWWALLSHVFVDVENKQSGVQRGRLRD